MPYILEGHSRNWNPPSTGGATGGGGTGTVSRASKTGSPGLITSTGGLFGDTGLLLVPFFDVKLGKNYLANWDSSNFDTEEDCTYFFKMEDLDVGRNIAIHKAVLVYRDIGRCRLTVGVTSYLATDDKYNTKSQTKFIGHKTPDLKLHTQDFNFVITGERPQLFVSRKANDGPFSAVSLTMVGHADEKEQL